MTKLEIYSKIFNKCYDGELSLKNSEDIIEFVNWVEKSLVDMPPRKLLRYGGEYCRRPSSRTVLIMWASGIKGVNIARNFNISKEHIRQIRDGAIRIFRHHSRITLPKKLVLR